MTYIIIGLVMVIAIGSLWWGVMANPDQSGEEWE